MSDYGTQQIAEGRAIRSHEDLRVWQRAIDLVEQAYAASRTLPPTEQYGMASQMQRAAVSVPANIAEGHGRHHLKEYLQHLRIARASLMEVETYVVVMERVKYVDREGAKRLREVTGEVGRMLNGLIRSLTPDTPPPTSNPRHPSSNGRHPTPGTQHP